MIAGNMLATWYILKMNLDARNIKDWQNILPPKDAIVKEMQLQQEKSKINKQIDRLPSVEERARLKVGQQGGMSQQILGGV